MIDKPFDYKEFDQQWLQLGREICQGVYTDPEIQKIKHSFRKNNFLTLEEKSQFINICDRTKYEYIYKKYGAEGSEGYKHFSAQWAKWFEAKGVGSQQNRGQRNSVEHILFGSTPDPVEFLLHFEEEMLGSIPKHK